jgi:hypothetical protein
VDHETHVAKAVGQQHGEVLEDVLLALIAGRLARQGDRERTLQVAETIPEGGDKASALDDLATASIDAGRSPEVRHAAQRIRPPAARARALLRLIARRHPRRRAGAAGRSGPWRGRGRSAP